MKMDRRIFIKGKKHRKLHKKRQYDDTVSPIGERIPNAIDFLQHIRECCYRNINCRNCPVYHHMENPKNILEDGYCRLDRLSLSTDEEIIDIVQDVEKWGKENGWWIENGE